MSSPFDLEEYPGRPRILFIGAGDSSHTHSWIDLLSGRPFNVRLFTSSNAIPPDEWSVRTYITAPNGPPRDPASRMHMLDSANAGRTINWRVGWLGRRSWNPGGLAAEWLLRILKDWRPHIVHTLGLEGAGKFYFNFTRQHGLAQAAKWVLQLRGGSDLQLGHLNPESRVEIARVLRSCDQLLSDNQQNFEIARGMGVREEQLSMIGTVPGSGGIDVKTQARNWPARPSERRVILWPKVYECPWSKATPVYEALRQCWERIQPCEVELLAMTPLAQVYYWKLPKRIRDSCRLNHRIPRADALKAMTHARVMLAPSLVDGTPNAMLEAMASGALPIVSPLESIRAAVKEERNVLFARNLYPDEIAAALVSAMTDDKLVETAAVGNLELVSRIANRDEVRTRVVGFYESLAGMSQEAERSEL